jgi:hypothetical protein
MEVWIITILAAPMLFFIYYLLESWPDLYFQPSDLVIPFTLFVVGGAASSPTLFIYLSVYEALSKRIRNNTAIVLISSIIPVFGILFSFKILFKSSLFDLLALLNNSDILLPGFYLISFIISTAYFSIKK